MNAYQKRDNPSITLLDSAKDPPAMLSKRAKISSFLKQISTRDFKLCVYDNGECMAEKLYWFVAVALDSRCSRFFEYVHVVVCKTIDLFNNKQMDLRAMLTFGQF